MSPTLSSNSTPPITTTSYIDGGSTTTFSTIPADILQAHILPRLDGPSLISTSCICHQLQSLSSEENLWKNICHSTWPSTCSATFSHLIASFPGKHRSFFVDAYLLSTNTDSNKDPTQSHDEFPSRLISCVDAYYDDIPLYSKVIETETKSGWFRYSPFRIDMFNPEEGVSTSFPYPKTEGACEELATRLRLSWIVIDPTSHRVMNLSSHVPVSVSVQRHWLSGEVRGLFGTVLRGRRGSSSEFVQCGVVVTCGGSKRGNLQLREVSLQMEDLDGIQLKGKDGLVILDSAFEGRRGRASELYVDFLQKKRERRERTLRTEQMLEKIFVRGFLVLTLALPLLGFFLMSKR